MFGEYMLTWYLGLATLTATLVLSGESPAVNRRKPGCTSPSRRLACLPVLVPCLYPVAP